jgi:hypothetical protein
MMRRHLLLPGLALLIVVSSRTHALGQSPNAPKPTPQQLEFFESRVRPVLAEQCLSCHGPKKQRGGLRLDSAAALRQGGDNGPILVPGHPEKSPLIQAVRQEGDVKMPPPPRTALPSKAVADLTAWVKMGAPWPADKGAPAAVSVWEAAKKHWAFQPVREPALPAVKDPGWAETPVDRFILAALEANGLSPSPDADRRTLLRRVTFDLTGLPPTPAELEAFLADRSPDAYKKVVDRLLASPAYGERWGRHWLDVARYADTRGTVPPPREKRYPFAFTYRDYVIRAFNEDKPFDRFILEQLAADRLLARASADGGRADRRSLAALGFITVGAFQQVKHDIIDDRIDVVTRGLLGLTVTCARCHDHKYDPIPTKDYYSLYGVFANAKEPLNSRDLPLIEEPRQTPAYLAFEKGLAAREAAVAKFKRDFKGTLKGAKRSGADRKKLLLLQNDVEIFLADQAGVAPRAMVVADETWPTKAYVFVRGNPNNHGPAVPRQFLQVLSGPRRQPFKGASGRLDLALAIASRDNPLTARVLVNRVWLGHFGAGLVSTPSDFGLAGEPPSHPELLDWLAWRFLEDGWSVKQLHRHIVLSHAYRQASADVPRAVAVDPDNRLLWKVSRRRLDFEEVRDALLQVAGTLDRQAAGGPVVDLFANAPYPTRRTVYGLVSRDDMRLYRAFDYPDPDVSSDQRPETVVPQQALFLLNSSFVLEQVRRFAHRPDVSAAAARPEERIQQFYRLAYGRAADPEEVRLGLRFLEEAARLPAANGSGLDPWERYAQVLLLANEFVYVD